jgi:hypothetical protein
MVFEPAISNLAAIKASRDTALHWAWTLTGVAADTAWLKDGLTLKSAMADGKVEIALCLDNSGPLVCRSATVTVSRTVGGASSILDRSAAILPGHAGRKSMREWRDASGRLRNGDAKSGSPASRFGTSARSAP